MLASLVNRVLLTALLGLSIEAQASQENESRIRCSDLMEVKSLRDQILWQQSSNQTQSPEYRRAEKARVFFNKLRQRIEVDSKQGGIRDSSEKLASWAQRWSEEIETIFSCTLSEGAQPPIELLRFETLSKIWDAALVQALAAWRELEKHGLNTTTSSRVLASLQNCISTKSNLRNPPDRIAVLQRSTQNLSEEEKLQYHSLLVSSEFWGLIDEARAHLCATAVQ